MIVEPGSTAPVPDRRSAGPSICPERYEVEPLLGKKSLAVLDTLEADGSRAPPRRVGLPLPTGSEAAFPQSLQMANSPTKASHSRTAHLSKRDFLP